MGMLRFYLAAAVIAWHTRSLGGYLPVPGFTAVQVFYIISGFYMALVLNTKYQGPGSYRVFFANRLLKIFPIYWLVGIATLLFCLLADRVLGHSRLSVFHEHSLTWSSWLYLLGVNLTIIGQDTTLFFDLLPNGTLAWPADFNHRQGPPLYLFMLVPQAWSLSLELMFYAIAPFLVRRRLGVILALIALTFTIRYMANHVLGFDVDPWHYRFFPAELGLFLAGTVSYQIDTRLRTLALGRGWLVGVSVAYFLVAIAYRPLLNLVPGPQQQAAIWAFLGLTTLVIPFLFRWTERNRLDRYIGELSYPIYVVHILVLTVIANLLPRQSGELNAWAGLVCLLLSSALAMILMKFFVTPIERYRHKLTPQDLTAHPAPPTRVPAPSVS